MDFFNIKKAAFTLYQEFPKESNKLKKYVVDQDDRATQVLSDAERSDVLNHVAEVFLCDDCTLSVARLFGPLLLELLIRVKELKNDISEHEAICRLLARLIRFYPEVSGFAHQYFETEPALFIRFINDYGPPNKKPKFEPNVAESLQNLLVAAIRFLDYDVDYFREIFNWSPLSTFIRHKNADIRWLAYRCMFILFNVPGKEQNLVIKSSISKEDELKLNIKYSHLFSSEINHLSHSLTTDSGENQTQLSTYFRNTDLSDDVVNIQGVLFKKLSSSEFDNPSTLVSVPSVQQTLLQISLALSTGVPVLLQGPVGCGKTSLVEHLACLTGRDPQRDLLKIQLGDQMDSKLLIGSYTCTQTLGKFVWQPGILTLAMTQGYWLLLEDIDCASMEIISTLAPIIQSKRLVLPGHSNPIRAHSGFQLFATQRLLIGHDQSYLEFKSNAAVLDKMWQTITIPNFTDEELKTIIKKNWPGLLPIVDRILTIYHYFSSDGYSGQTENGDKLCFPSSVKRNRLISTRDLFKFCKRIANGFKLNSAETSTLAFQHSMDCFCYSLPSVSDRIQAAESIGVHFNFPKSKVRTIHIYS